MCVNSSLILAKSVVSYMYNVVMLQAIYMYVHWIGLVHWTGGLDWTDGLTLCIFNETNRLI